MAINTDATPEPPPQGNGEPHSPSGKPELSARFEAAPGPRIKLERKASIEAAMAGLTNAINYVSTRTIEMDAALVQQLVVLRDTYITGNWQTADEQAFWPAYHMFVASVGVPVDRLIFSRRWTRYIAWVVTLLSVAALVVLVLQLSFWAGLDSTVRQIEAIDGEMLAAKQKLIERSLMMRADAAPVAAPGSTAEAAPLLQVRAERDVLAIVIGQKCIQLMALHKLLSERVASERVLLLSKQLPGPGGMPESGEACLESASRSQAMQAYVLGNARILRSAQQDYVLPVLFGLLGTIAFILRSLTNDIRDARLTVTGLVGAMVRIPLGMLAGLAIGWLQSDKPDGVFGQITPWALAFIAGYSVELVFTAMDRVIGAFTADRGAASPGGSAG